MRTFITALLAFWVGVTLAQNLTTGALGNATVVTNNPVGQSFVGTLPKDAFFTAGSLDGNVQGSITVKTGANGVGVDYVVSFSNLPKEGGPFPYHIHQSAVPSNGNCTATLAHLDPFVRGEDPVCNAEFPQTCQVGDLSGKYGKITSDPFEATFHDEFGSLNIGSNASIQDRSFVVHFANKTRITCANFAVSGYGNGTTNMTTSIAPTYSATGTGGVLPTTASTAAGTSGSASPTTTPIISGAAIIDSGLASAAMVAIAVLFTLF
ncbi:hypothetical protein PFICI_01350 [Pestalotiopsis fici W106-1]|uniref:superoxide dismutase n=1 Tax=Pestalotiopsis fici (strain W106-1 / CGMCC3.15140) TaxID=1229662 RepID=W3XPS6_PESFW|nr:uncharacterized protein PFICI_01350 [Pestalotiopsis fici W106-1]ETS87522.1 hypothetical protein PFICI_01350 [Pestalotiopsis fici W106-1]